MDRPRRKIVLTADMGGRLELGGHLGIHGDHHFLLGVHDVVPLLHLHGHPLSKLVAEHGSKDVDQPLFWYLGQINLIRQVHRDDRLVGGVFKELFGRQVLVLRHVHGLDLVVADVGLPPGHDVLQEVDRHVVYRKKRFVDPRTRHLPYGGRKMSHSPAKNV